MSFAVAKRSGEEEVKEEKKGGGENESNENGVIVVGESYYERKDVVLELERDVYARSGFSCIERRNRKMQL